MAITRYAGDRFTIGAGETKPTGVLDGAVLIDTGNLELYIKRNGAWVEVTGAGGGNLIATGAIVDEISGNLIITGQTLQTQITSNDSDISTLDSTTVKLTTNQSIAGNKIFTNDVTINNLTVTGTETIINVENLAIKDNIIEINSGESGAGISKISGGIVIDRGTATNANILYNDTNDRFELNFPLAVEGEVVATASNLITTGQTLQTQITSNDSDISTLTSNLVTTGQTLQTQITNNDSDISTLTTNLGTTGQTLQTQITNNDSDISTLTSNLVTTGQTLTTNINTVSSNLVSTGAVVDDISGNLITTGQTLQTQITSNDSDIATLTSNLVTTGQTVTDNLIATGAIVDDISGNLITTGQTLTNEIATVSGLVTTGTLNGSGVTNYVARWVDGNTLTSGVLVDNGTNVGINVPSPNYPLEISSSDNATIRIEDTTNASKLDLRAEDSAVLIRSTSNFPMKFDVNQTERMRIDTAGNVGIGTNDPLGKLVVKAAIPTVYAGVTPDISSSLISIANLQASETTNDQAQLQFNVTGGSYNRVGSIGLIAESASNRKGALVFTTDDAGTRTEKMRIAGDGNVGIGVADPKQTVHIGKSASNALGPVLMLDNTAGGSTDSSAIIFASGGDTYQRAKIVSTVEGASAYLGNLGFYTGRSDTTGVTEKVRITGSGQLLISDGLVGTPSLSFINDTDTGMWRPGVNQLRLVTGGTDAIIIDSSQHVGVGIVPLAKFEVDLNQTSGTLVADNYAHFGGQHHTNGSVMGITLGYREANLLYRKVGIVARGLGDNAARQDLDFLVSTVNSSTSVTPADAKLTISGLTGNVGIGTVSPSAGLHVLNSAEPTVLFESTNAGSSGSRLQLYHNSASPADNDVLSNIQITGKDSGGTKRYAALIQTIAADVNASSVDGDIRFLTYKSDTASEVMRITHDETVGIGTAVPMSTYKLHVYETIDTGVGILAQNPNTGTSATTSVSLLNNSGSLAGFILPSSNYSAVSSWSNRLVINTDSGISNGIIVRPSAGGFTVSTTGLSNPDLYVENGTGDVGIGTASPDAKLHIKALDNSVPAEIRLEHNDGITQTAKIVFNQTGENKLVLSTQYQSSSDGNLIQFAPADNIAMTIRGGTGTSDGFVGIGTASPTQKLQVGGTTVEDTAIKIDSAANSNANKSWLINATQADALLRIGSENNPTSLVIKGSDGNVGIGTVSPTSRLHIVSNIATGSIFEIDNQAGNQVLRVDQASTQTALTMADHSAADKITLNASSLLGGCILLTDTSASSYLSIIPASGTVFNESGAAVDFRIEGDTNANLFFLDGSTDRIGINAPSPGAKLHVIEADTGEAFRIDGASSGFAMIVEGGTSYKTRMRGGVTIGNGYGASTPPANGLIVEGDVGIGTANPSAKLHIFSGTDTIPQFKMFGANADGIRISMGVDDADDVASIYAWDENDGAGEVFADLNLGVSHTSAQNGIFISGSTQNVGIGTVIPLGKLHIYQSGGSLNYLEANPSAEDAYIGNMYGRWDGKNTSLISFRTGSDTTNKDNGDIAFFTSTSGSLVRAMTIDENQRVGIGTATPRALLDVRTTVDGDSFPSRITSTDGSFTDEQKLGIEFAQNAVVLNQFYSKYDISLGGWGFGFKGNSSGLTDELFTIGANGNVGIGTASPTRLLTLENDTSTVVSQSQLRINNAGAGDAYIYMYAGSDWSFGIDNSDTDKFKFNASNDVSDGTEVLTIQRDGNVGIGTGNPNSKLDVLIGSRSTTFAADNGTTWHDLIVRNPNNTQNAAVGLAFELNSTYHTNAAAGIAAVKEVGSSDYGAGLAFITRPQSAAAVERMRIDSSGNVGIGMTPATKLDITGTFRVSDWGHFANTGKNQIALSNSGSNFGFITNPSTGTWSLGYGSDRDSLGNSVLSWNDSNNVGIGTAIPAYGLDVKKSSIRTTSRTAEKDFSVGFNNATANQKVDISFPYFSATGFWGYLEVTLTASYSNQLSTGKITKLFAVGLNPPTGTSGNYAAQSYDNTNYYTSVYGAIASQWGIEGINFNTTTGQYYITIAHRVSTGNGLRIKVKAFADSSSMLESGVFGGLSAGSVYTTDTTAFDAAVIEMDALTVAGKIETLTAMGTAGEWPSSKIRLETTNNVDTTGWQGISFDTSSTDNYGWSIGANRSSNGRGSFRVYEHVNNVTGTERFTILQDGNVGIGTGNPFSALDVNTGTITLREGPTIYHQITSNSDGLNIINNAPAANVTRSIIFKSSVTGGSITEKMRITGDGNVGIGTGTVSAKLHVQGNFRLNGSIAQYSTAANSTVLNRFWDNTGGVLLAELALYDFNPSILGGQLSFGEGISKYATLRGTGADGGKLTLETTASSNSVIINGNGDTIFNESGAAFDFRIEGDTNANLFFVDGSADKIGIGTNAPAQLLHVYGLTQLGTRGKTEGGAVIVHASFGETLGSASTILGNSIVPGTATSTVQRSKSDAGNFVRIKYNTGICFHTNITNTINTDIAETTNERVRIDLTGNLLISDGLVGAPALSFINDTNTGMWRAGSDNLRLVTGGSDAIVINSSQAIQLPDYGQGNNTGTKAYFLAVDSSGNVIEDSGGGGGTIGDGTITLTAGTGLTGGGSFTTNQTANATITFNATGGGGGGGTVTEVTVGEGLGVTNGTTTPDITLDLSELPDMTDTWVTADDYFIVLDSGSTQKKKVSSAIFGTNAFNSTSFITAVTSSTSDQLTVTGGTALAIVTGDVVNGGTALATGNQIYDFVIGLGYSTTTGTVTGTGTDGTIAQWSSVSGIEDSIIVQNSDGNIGISTTPAGASQKLHVNGGLRVVDAFYDSGGDAGINGQVLSSTGSGTNWTSAGTGTVTSVTSATANQLTINQSSPAPALTIVTGPVADAGTALATGDQIHTFVTDFGYMSHWDLQVNGSSNSEINNSKVVNFAAGAGAAISKGTSAGGFTLTFSLSTSSDYRLKKNISTFNSEAWTKIKNVNLRKFDFDEDAVEVAISSPNTEIHKRPDQYKDNLGFIAHELAKAEINGAVIGDKDAVDENGNFIYQKVNYLELVPVLWGALNEAIFKIETLETKVRELQNK